MKLFNVLKYLSYFIFTIFIISSSPNNKQITYTEEQIDNPKNFYRCIELLSKWET